MGATEMRLSICFIQRIFFAIVGPVKYWTDNRRMLLLQQHRVTPSPQFSGADSLVARAFEKHFIGRGDILNTATQALGFLVALVCGQALGQPSNGAIVQPAVDGIFEAFKTRPLVALSDEHGMVKGMDLYAALVRDPRFASEVGNVVVEFGASGRQQVIDRYLAGDTVHYS